MTQQRLPSRKSLFALVAVFAILDVADAGSFFGLFGGGRATSVQEIVPTTTEVQEDEIRHPFSRLQPKVAAAVQNKQQTPVTLQDTTPLNTALDEIENALATEQKACVLHSRFPHHSPAAQ